MASAPNSSPFLQLPREIRDEIYRRLLTTPFDASAGEYHMYPQIPTVNKQVSTEATKIPYQEKEIVLVELDRSHAREWSTIKNIPHLRDTS